MKKRLLQWLICPGCSGELFLETFAAEKDEVIEGLLVCECKKTFPVIRGVPRLLLPPLSQDLLQLYPEFFIQHPDVASQKTTNLKGNETQNIKDTMNRFGYEWTEFIDYDCDNFSRFASPLPADFFEGKLGLDAGCGGGRHAYQASKKGAEIIAFDVSQAVDTAFQKNRNEERVHIIQSDIYHLPFKQSTFEFIYSLGVLHHLPDPEKGYKTLIPLLKENGSLFVWLYAYAPRKVALEILRSLARRLSNKNIRYMAYLCNLLDYGIFSNLFKFFHALPSLKNVSERIFPLRIQEYAGHGFSVSYTDWFDRLSAPLTHYYRKQEMEAWLNRSNLKQTRLLPEGDSWWWLYGER